MPYSLPNDPVMLLSFVNLKLRDECPGLDDFCKSYDIPENILKEKLASIDYEYAESNNQFV